MNKINLEKGNVYIYGYGNEGHIDILSDGEQEQVETPSSINQHQADANLLSFQFSL